MSDVLREARRLSAASLQPDSAAVEAYAASAVQDITGRAASALDAFVSSANADAVEACVDTGVFYIPNIVFCN